MSSGPVTVPIRVRPASASRRVAARAPPWLSASTYPTGAGSSRAVPHGRPCSITGTPASWSSPGQRIRAVQRHERDAVDVAAAGEPGEPLPLGVVGEHGEHELHVVRGDGGVHPPQDEREERVGEEPLLRLGHDEGDRVAAAGHQRPRGPVRDVRQLGGGAQDGVAGVVADPGRPGEHAAGGGPRDPGARGDRLEGRRLPVPCGHSHLRPLWAHRTPLRALSWLVVAGASVTSQSPRRRRRAIGAIGPATTRRALRRRCR